MNTLGIYFGSHIISAVETKGRKPINNIHIPRSVVSLSESSEEKVPEEIKIVALLKDEFKKNNIEAKEAAVCLSGNDLIIRSFEMPIMPANELQSAVIFEAKKYIPFKIEDLISDFQWVSDKSIQRNHILFVGIKKEILDKYNSILSRLGFKINSIEYSAFSVLRMLKLDAVIDKGIIAVITADLKEDDEINFMVLENGFPLFSRDITFAGGQSETLKSAEELPSGITSEKLNREFRISLDYYHRKFPAKAIKKVCFISPHEYRSDLEAFTKEMGLHPQFIDVSRYIGRPVTFFLSFIKCYSASLCTAIKAPLKINLSAPKLKALADKETRLNVTALSLDPRLAIAGLLICIIIFLVGYYRIQPLRKELNEIINRRIKVSNINPDAAYEELSSVYSAYTQKVSILNNFVKKQISLTSLLDIIPRITPKEIWLDSLSFKKEANKQELTLEGIAYLGESNKELELVNSFISDIKKNSAFNTYFKDINLVSLNSQQYKNKSVTYFEISCVTKDKK